MFDSRRDEPACLNTGSSPNGNGALARVRDEAFELIDRERLTVPAFWYCIHSVTQIRGDMVFVEEALPSSTRRAAPKEGEGPLRILNPGRGGLRAPALADLSDNLTAVAAATCTLGPALETRMSELFAERRPSLALALDSLGTEMLFRLSDSTYARIRRDARARNLRAGPQESPGDAGIPLAAQPAVLALAGVAANSVTVSASRMLSPVKSVSFLVALGPDLPARASSGRCGRCASRDRCAIRPH